MSKPVHQGDRYQTFDEFFPFYLREHSEPATRAFHYVAAFASIGAILFGIIVGPWWIALLAPVFGYGPAWISHAFIEHNKPATFTYPGWSLISDYYMTWLFLTGRLDKHLVAAGVKPNHAGTPAE